MCGKKDPIISKKFEFKQTPINEIEYQSLASKTRTFQLFNKSRPMFRICKNCLRLNFLFDIGCGHKFCFNCIEKELLNQEEYLKNNEIICWVCFELLDYRFALMILSNQCLICYNFYFPEFFKELSCGHLFCKTCIFSYISEKIETKEVKNNQLVCPYCREKIEPEFVLKHFPKDVFERLNETLADFYESSDNDCRISRCKNCQVLVEVSIQIENVTCSLCGKEFCHFCYFSHLEGECKFRVGQTVNYMDDKRCPWCFNQVFKERGCNYVKCGWPGCKGSYFCYLCLKPLNSNVYSHFPDGAYVNNCDTLESMKENINNN